MQYQLLEQCKKPDDENKRSKVDSIRIRTLEIDIIMLKRELDNINEKKAEVETNLENFQYQVKHIKEENIKALEKKYKHEIKEMKHAVYMLMKNKNSNKECDKVEKKAIVKLKSAHGRTDESKGRIEELEKECERLSNENFELSQELQYSDFKLKVITNIHIECDWNRR